MSLIKIKYGTLDIENAKYVEENDNIIYIIRGEINDSDHFFKFDNKATLLKHNQDLKDAEIPLAVLKSVKETYPGYDIRDADLLEKGKTINYKLRLKKSKEQVNVYLNPEGKILKVK